MATRLPFEAHGPPRARRCCFFLSPPKRKGPLRNPKADTTQPQTALSLCNDLQVVKRQAVPPGTAIAVSADGKTLATWVHTTTGAALDLHNRASGVTQRAGLVPPALPPGIPCACRKWRFLGWKRAGGAHHRRCVGDRPDHGKSAISDWAGRGHPDVSRKNVLGAKRIGGFVLAGGILSGGCAGGGPGGS